MAIYNVYDNGKLVFKGLSPRKVFETTGLGSANVSEYARNGKTFRKRYTFKRVDKVEKKQDEWSLKWKREWDKVRKQLNKSIEEEKHGIHRSM